MCCKTTSWVVLILGVLFLLQDLFIWHFWGITWPSVAFILLGLGMIYSKGCCKAPTAPAKAPKSAPKKKTVKKKK